MISLSCPKTCHFDLIVVTFSAFELILSFTGSSDAVGADFHLEVFDVDGLVALRHPLSFQRAFHPGLRTLFH